MLKNKLNTSVKKDFANYLAYNTILGKPSTAQNSREMLENADTQRYLRNRNQQYGSSLT